MPAFFLVNNTTDYMLGPLETIIKHEWWWHFCENLSDSAYTQPFLWLFIEADIIVMSIMHIQFWKRKCYWALGTSQNSKFLCIKKLQQSHTSLFLSSILMICWALNFCIRLQPLLSKQTNKQKKKMGRKAGFLQSCRKMVSQEWAWDWNRSNMPFGYVLLMSHDSKIEPLSQCEIKEVKPGAYSLYRMGRYCSWSFLLFLWGRRAWLWGRIYKCVQCIDSMCIHPIQDILYIVYICVWTWTYMNTDTLKKKTRWLVLYQFS